MRVAERVRGAKKVKLARRVRSMGMGTNELRLGDRCIVVLVCNGSVNRYIWSGNVEQ